MVDRLAHTVKPGKRAQSIPRSQGTSSNNLTILIGKNIFGIRRKTRATKGCSWSVDPLAPINRYFAILGNFTRTANINHCHLVSGHILECRLDFLGGSQFWCFEQVGEKAHEKAVLLLPLKDAVASRHRRSCGGSCYRLLERLSRHKGRSCLVGQ